MKEKWTVICVENNRKLEGVGEEVEKRRGELDFNYILISSPSHHHKYTQKYKHMVDPITSHLVEPTTCLFICVYL